jgi:hypothetical protein
MGTNYFMKTTEFGFFAVNMAIYTLNVTFLSHMIKFLIDSHVVTEGVEITVEILQILLTLFGYVMVKI